MILESLEAENFQKYDRIRIANLPERGIVGVVGENESGKSTLGEALAFAFFGRTLHADETHVRDVIHWGKDSAHVTVTFRIDATSYRVTRELDRDGSYTALLEKVGPGEVLARGVGKVNRKLEELLRIPFEEFRYSFYLGQKELSLLHDASPDARKRMLDRMIGVNNIEDASKRVGTQLAELRARRRALEDDAAVHREVSRQIAVDPKEKEKAVATVRTLGDERKALEAELSRAGFETEEVEKNAAALGVARALGLRAILRGYGVAFARLAAWLRQGAGQLHAHVQGHDREISALALKLEEYRVYEAKREELANVVKVRQAELDAQLKNTIEADYSPEDAMFITPNGKAEQLSYAQKKLQEAAADQERLAGWATRRITVGALLWLGGLGLLLWLHVNEFFYFVVFGILYMLWGLLTRSNAADAGERRSRLSMNSDRLAEDVGKCENARQACARFDVTNAKSMADNVTAIGSQVAADLHKTLVNRFGEFLGKPEGHSDELLGKLNTLRDEAAAARREIAEVELLTADLEEEIERLSRGGHARVARPAAGPGNAYQNGEAREWRGRVRAMIERCGKARFELEAAPVDALDRDFAEFEPALGKLPPALSSGLNVSALAELDGCSSALDVAALEKTLGEEGGKLAGLAGAAEELDSRHDALARRQQELKLGISRASLRTEELEREIGRIEPGIARGLELERLMGENAQKLAEVDGEIAVHETLLEMFAQLRDQMRGRFGPQIAEYIGWVLPQLTGERYREVKVKPDLDVEVYSSEKSDWVDLNGLSGGTVDQLFLTLRLAFSKALLHTKLSADHKQYLFFDEPLSSFDDKRSGSFLELLKKFHSNFDQVFVVTHLQGAEKHFDLTIRTSIDTRELVSN